MVEQNQPQEQIQPLMVQAMWFATVVQVIMGIAVVANVLFKVIGEISEAREAEKK